MTSRDILRAIRTQNWHVANEGFAQVIQAKLADRLAAEKRAVVNEAVINYNQNDKDDSHCALCQCRATGSMYGFLVCDYHKTHGEDDPPCPKCGGRAKNESYIVSYPGKHDVEISADDEYEAKKRAAKLWGFSDGPHTGASFVLSPKGNKMTAVLKEGISDTMSVQEVQRVFDELGGDVEETEILCGVRNLRASENGEVMSYISEAITRPNDLVGWGYDDTYMNNPYHNVLRAHKFEYNATYEAKDGTLSHRYTRGTQQAEVTGNQWKVLNGGKRLSGGHPNTDRSAADLDRALVSEAFGQSFDILPGVDQDIEVAVTKVNDILDKAQDQYNAKEGLDADVRRGFKHRLDARTKSKYTLLDRVDANETSRSGCMMVDRTDGKIYGTKAYGVVNKIHQYGTAADPNIKKMAIQASVLERLIIMRDF